MAKPRILTIGNSSMELHLKLKTMPERGEKSITELGYNFVPGGRSLVSAVAVSQFGCESMFCTKIGDDIYGNKLRSALVDVNINPRFIITDKKHQTGFDTVITDSTGIPRIISHVGANAFITETDIEEALISYPDAVILQGDLSCDNIYETVYLANKKKIPVILDPASVDFELFDLEALGDIEIFTPNAYETKLLTGILPNDADSCLKACVKIINKIKCNYIVIKLSEKGCYVFDGVYSQIVPSFETDVVDRRGVGAIFNAGLASAYINTRDIIKSTVYASVCASVSLTKNGEYTSVPSISDVNDFIVKNNLNFN